MHIAVVTASIASGGAERVISELVNQWCEYDDVKCTLILLHVQPLFYNISSKVEIIEIGKKNSVFYIDKLLKYKKVREIIKSINADVVLSMPEEIGIYVIGALLGTGVPVIVSERNNPRVMPYKKITRLLRYLLYPYVDGLIFQSPGAMNFFSNEIKSKSVILPNPLNIDKMPVPYLKEKEKVVVSVGRLEKQKNFQLLIEAYDLFWKNHNEYSLIIYGEGSLRNDLEELAKNKDSGKSIFLPGRDENVLEKIKNASMFILSSDYEGVPNALIEAMAMGLNCISTDCEPGGAAMLIDNGKNGLLVPTGNKIAMAEAMQKMHDLNNNGDNLMSINSIDIRYRFDAKKVALEWFNYIKKFILS